MKTKQARKSVEEKRRIVEGYERSGESQQEYAARNGIGLSTLGLWLRQGGRARKARLVEVDVAQHSQLPGVESYRLSLSGGVCLEFGRGFKIAELRSLLEVVREWC